MTKPGPTETRVRAALLRLWGRVPSHANDAEWKALDVRDEVIADGQTRLQIRTIQGAGLEVSGGWYALGGGAEYTYERGVFRVRKREPEDQSLHWARRIITSAARAKGAKRGAR